MHPARDARVGTTRAREACMRGTTFQLTSCIACGAGDGREIASADALRRELEWLWEFHARRLRAGVPIARLTDRVVFTQATALRLTRCDRCGLVFRNPIERNRALLDRYRGHVPDRATLRSLHLAQRAA